MVLTLIPCALLTDLNVFAIFCALTGAPILDATIFESSSNSAFISIEFLSYMSLRYTVRYRRRKKSAFLSSPTCVRSCGRPPNIRYSAHPSSFEPS